MEEHTRKSENNALGIDIDLYSIIRDILKNWWVILALAISAALLTFIQVNRAYHPTYRIEATYVITSKGVNNTVYGNLSTARDTAARFSQIINSPTLMNKVAEELGTSGVQGTVKSDIVPETNLLTLKVTSGTPQMAYKILQSVMKNYPSISEYLVGDAFMDVLMAPVIPTEPDNPLSVKSAMVKAFALTVLAMILIIGFFSHMKDTVRTKNDVEKKLDTRLLGCLCYEKQRKKRFLRFRKRKNSLLITNPLTSFRYVEMVQKCSRKVRNHMEQQDAKTLMVTSYMENEGKSTVTANLALAMAQVGKKVVLVDLDLRKPSQYKIFGMFGYQMRELGDILNGAKSAEKLIRISPGRELYTVFNTKEYARSTEMLTAGYLEPMLEFLKKRFDYVIIDTPPMSTVADTEEIAHMADASLVVVREHTASAKNINDILDILNGCKAKPIGCVFNGAHDGIGRGFSGEYGYGEGYGKYYGKYYGRT